MISTSLQAALEAEVDLIGLNVDSENGSALRVYDKLGFRFVAAYDELVLHPVLAKPDAIR